jgi:hypothetical protein
MVTMFPFAGLNGDGVQPRPVGAAAQSARPVPAAVTVRRLEPAADGVRSVLAGELSLFRCRYQAPGGADPYEITVTPLADGDGAVVAHRPAPEPHGAAPVR